MTDIIPKVIETIKKLANEEVKENYILFNYPKKDDCKVSTQGDIYSVILKLDSDLQKHITSYVNRYHDGVNEQKYIISCISYILDTFIAQYSIVKANDLSYFPVLNGNPTSKLCTPTCTRCLKVNDRSSDICSKCLDNERRNETELFKKNMEDCPEDSPVWRNRCRNCGVPSAELIEYKDVCYCEDCYGAVIRKEGRGNLTSKVENKKDEAALFKKNMEKDDGLTWEPENKNKKESRCGNCAVLCDNLIERNEEYYCDKCWYDVVKKEGEEYLSSKVEMESKKKNDGNEGKKEINKCKFVFRGGKLKGKVCGEIIKEGEGKDWCRKCWHGVCLASPN